LQTAAVSRSAITKQQNKHTPHQGTYAQLTQILFNYF
jgi:hypothetical protein